MIGTTIGHYRVVEKIGEGGMGVVYKATDMRLDRPVALKFLSSYTASSEEERSRFIREAKAVSSLDHPNICTVYEADQTEDGQMFIAMAYYEGQALNKVIEQGRLSLQDALRIAIQVAEGLQAAHEKRIIHRDVKPGNIVVTTQGLVKLMDFGLASQVGRTKLTRSKATVGTAAYMSPEQATGEGADHRSDLWSLGVVFYEMLTGKLPFRGEHEAALMYSIVNEEPPLIQQTLEDASPELVHIIARALEKDPEERYQSAADLLIDLRRLKKDTSRTTYSSVAWQTGAGTFRRGRRVIPVFIFVAIALAATMTIIFSSRAPRLNPNRVERELNLPFQRTYKPSISSDGNWMVLPVQDEDGVRRLYFGTSDGRNFRRISDEPVLSYPEISPDGKLVAFTRPGTEYVSEVWVMSTVDGKSRRVGPGWSPKWSKDGTRLGHFAYERGQTKSSLSAALRRRTKHSKLYLQFESVTPSGTDRRLEFADTTSSVWLSHHSVSWSPDKLSFAYVHTNPDASTELYVYDGRNHALRQLTHDRAIVDEVEWTNQGAILFSSTRDGPMALWALMKEGDEPQRITAGVGYYTYMSLSSDASMMLCNRMIIENEIWVVSLRDQSIRRLNLDSKERVTPAISPQGTKVAFGQRLLKDYRNALMVYDLNSGELEQLLPDERYVFEISWSPDGKYLAFGSTPFLHNRSSDPPDSVRSCVIDVSKRDEFSVVGMGVPSRWLDDEKFTSYNHNWVSPGTMIQNTAGGPQQIFYKDTTIAGSIGSDLIYFVDHRLGKGRKRYLVRSPSGVPRLLPPELQPGNANIRFSRRANSPWALVHTYKNDEVTMRNLATGEVRKIPAAVGALVLEAGLRNVDMNVPEQILVISKNRTTEKTVLIEGIFQ